jgi:hypothetical protein
LLHYELFVVGNLNHRDVQDGKRDAVHCDGNA